MPNASPLLNNFNGGEISPKIDARSDISKYFSGCRTLENMLPFVEGGASRVPGTYYVGALKMSSKRARLIPFHFSTAQAYAIEFGDQYIRFYMNSGIIMDGVNVYEISSPYLEADLFQLKFIQSADVMYIFHPSYAPKKLTRTAHTSWTLTDYVAATQKPLTITNATKANPCVVTVTITAWVTATSYVIGNIRVNTANYYYCLIAHTSGTFSTDLTAEKWVKIDFPVAGDIVYITSVLGMTQINDTFFTVASPNSAAGTFQLSGINSTDYTAWTSAGTVQKTVVGTADHCPSCGAFFGQKLLIAGMNSHPQTIFISKVADYEDFTPDATDDSAGQEYSLVSGKVDRIRWMIGEDSVMIGTTGGVWKFDVPTTPTTDPPNAKKHIYTGVQNIQPQVVGDFIFWVTRSGLTVRQLTFDFGTDKYLSSDMTRLARHITLGSTMALSGIKDMSYQQEPMSILWAIRNDGQLLGFVCDLSEKVFAWFRVVTDGLFESVAVVSQDSQEDQVWMIVNRTILGLVKRYVEYFKPQEFFSQIKDCFFVHSGLSYDGGEPASISGISKAATAVVTVAAWPTDGVELVDFATAGWNDDGVKWKFLNGNLDHTNSDATAITATLGATIVAAHAYKVRLVGTGGGSACAYTLGGTAGTAIPAAGTFDIIDYITATNAGSLIITPGATSTVSFSSISVQELDYILTAGDKVNISGVVGMTEVNKSDPSTTAHTVGTVNIASRTFQLSGVDSQLYTAWSSGGTIKIVKNAFTAPDLLHLGSETVDALVDGVVDTGLSVSAAGAVTLTYYGNQIHVGLPFTSIVEPMKIHAGSQLGTARGKKQKINYLTCCFYETGEGVEVGPDSTNLKEVLDLEDGELNTMDAQFRFPGDWKDDATLYIKQDKPLPMTILALVPRVSLNED